MKDNDNPPLRRLPLSSWKFPVASTAERAVTLRARNHFNGHFVVGDGSGRGTPLQGGSPRVIYVESHLELSWGLCLEARHDIADLREQVAFGWRNRDGKGRTHFFDFLMTRTDGMRVGFMVRPEARVRGKFAEEMGIIARQARQSGFIDDVQLLLDTELDPIELHNAKMLHGFRTPIPHEDAVAASVIREMTGMLTLGELIKRTGLGALGFGALLRFIRCNVLAPAHHERISKSTLVFKKEAI